MRKVSSIILLVIAGFFFYTVELLAFVGEAPIGAKLCILLVFLVPALAALAGGLALTRFRNWRRDTGIVLLSASGFTAFVVLTFVCLLMTEEFRKMMKPDTLSFFSDYLSGGGSIVAFALLGWILVTANKRTTEKDDAPNGGPAAPPGNSLAPEPPPS